MSYIVAGIGYCDDFATCEYCDELFPVDEMVLRSPDAWAACEQCYKGGLNEYSN
jgi:hypothetical protein